jgi:hypothetical protein
VQRPRLGVVQHAEAQRERQRRRVPQLEQRPRERDREDDVRGEAAGLRAPVSACATSSWSSAGAFSISLTASRRRYLIQPFSL